MILGNSNLRSFLFLPLVLLGGVLTLASVVPVASGWFWLLEVPGHFRVQLACVLFLCSLGLGMFRFWKVSVFFAVAAVANASVLLPFYAGTPPEPMGENPSFRFVLFNVNSTTGDPAAVRRYLQKESFDVVVLQEYSSRWRDGLRGLPYPHQLVQVREDNFGMALFSKFPLKKADILYLSDSSVPSIRAEMLIEDTSVHLLALHPVPPVRREYVTWRDTTLREVAKTAAPGERYFIAGDLNTTPWNARVREIEQMVGVTASSNGFGFQPTWPEMIPLMGTVLDQVFSRGLTVVDHRVGDAQGSDHRPVEVTFELR